jgi:hypothetical protein
MPNPALQDLEVLVGRWRVELGNAQFVPDGGTLAGTLEVSWLDDALLVLRSGFEAELPPASTSVIGRNDSRADYEVLYADVRGVSRVYAMTFADGHWTQSRTDPGFHQRFAATVEADVIRGSWERSHDDGATWIHDFDLTYRRV